MGPTALNYGDGETFGYNSADFQFIAILCRPSVDYTVGMQMPAGAPMTHRHFCEGSLISHKRDIAKSRNKLT